MSFPYDASTKHLVDHYQPDFLALSRRHGRGVVQAIPADLSTVTAQADWVLRIQEDYTWLLHLELQSSRDPTLLPRLHQYNALLEYRHDLPVWSVVLLLRRQADHPELTGRYERRFGDEAPYRHLLYEVVRLWERPVEPLLASGLGVLSLAPLSDVTEAQLPGVIQRMQQRIATEASPEEGGRLWTATGVLMGMRYSEMLINQLLQGVQGMQDSTFYQGLLAKGRVEEARKLLLRLGQLRFGPATEATQSTIKALTELDRLERLLDRVVLVSSWEELFNEP